MARILVCDDSDFMRKTITEALENDDHEIIGEAADGKEAVEKFRELRPDLVTMDILMKTSGVAAVKEIKDIDFNAKIVIISILDNHQAEIVESIKLGVEGYVNKPIKREALLSEIRRVLALEAK